MAKIKVLTESMVNKIAAGEVIERPASVVKELVENALDAQAHKVFIEIKSGGKQSILVSDDGVGMEREDAELCILPHATSKMAHPSDLFAVSTLGFRGEALASIGAISRLVIETRSAEQAEGTRVTVEGGIRREVLPLGRGPGTTVMVGHMFFNTPARRKFLRHIDTESRYITRVVVQLAAAYPGVGFELVNQGRTVLHYLPAPRRERAAELLGIDPAFLVQVRLSEGGVEGEGFLSPPALCKKAKGKQFLVVRGRPIVSRGLGQAVYQGFGGLLGVDMHPSFLVWMDLDARKIDVNVHPTKREIRIADEGQVEEVLQYAVRVALKIPETPAFVYRKGTEFQPVHLADSVVPAGEKWAGILPEKEAECGRHDGTEMPQQDATVPLPLPVEQISFSLLSPRRPRFVKGERLGEEETDEPFEFPPLSKIWQLHDKYILTPIEEGLLLVDQQGAHQRILYEEALKAFDGECAAQQLLFPITLHLDAVEMEAVNQAKELWAGLGFSIREFGSETVIVEAVPVELEDWGEGEVFYGILHQYMEEKKTPGKNLKEALALSFAGQSSIRSGQKLSLAEMENLLAMLFKTEEPFVCPHGRPVIVKVELREVDKMFGRR